MWPRAVPCYRARADRTGSCYLGVGMLQETFRDVRRAGGMGAGKEVRTPEGGGLEEGKRSRRGANGSGMAHGAERAPARWATVAG